MNTKILRIILILTLVNKYLSSSVLKITNELKFGTYFYWQFCSPETFVNAFEIQTDIEEKNFSDEQGMTGIRLYCSTKNGTEIEDITSKVLPSGTWKGKNSCPPGAFVSGFRMKIQSAGGFTKDDTGANNMEMICNSSAIFNGRGNNRGDWTDWLNCPEDEFICGLRTKVEDTFTADRTGLVAVEMTCCNLTGEGRSMIDPNVFPTFMQNETDNDYGSSFNDNTNNFPGTNFNDSRNRSGIDDSFFDLSNNQSNSNNNGISFPG